MLPTDLSMLGPCYRTGCALEDIAKSTQQTKTIPTRPAKVVAVMLLAAPLCGCVGAGFDLFGGDRVDRTIQTNTIAGAGQGARTNSDEATIRNAVSSADLDRLGNGPLPWANTSTGSAGVVSVIKEEQSGRAVCRSFVTTRHAYDGIAAFNGKTCLLGDGAWHLMAFDRRS